MRELNWWKRRVEDEINEAKMNEDEANEDKINQGENNQGKINEDGSDNEDEIRIKGRWENFLDICKSASMAINNILKDNEGILKLIWRALLILIAINKLPSNLDKTLEDIVEQLQLINEVLRY